jgi:serine phosphatase RsbU (regulator of sigma subunit)
VGYNGLNRAVQEYRLIHPAEILDKLTELVEETFSKHDSEVRDGMDISLCLVDMDNCRMEWAGANNPVWVVRNGELTETKANKQPIGRYEGRKPFDNRIFELERGDVVYIFTDGYQDQFGGPGQKKFKASKMKEMFAEIYNKPLDEQQNFINQTIEQWRHCQKEDGTIEEVEQLDDICIIAFRM